MKMERRSWYLGGTAGLCLTLVLLAGCGSGEADEAQSLEQARSQLAIGKPKAAVIALKNAIRANTTNPESRHLLGRVYLDLFQGAEAESELRKALELGGSAPAVKLDLGEALLMQGKHEEVLDMLEPSGLAAPADAAELRALRGDALVALAKLERARGSYEAALEIDRTNTRAHLGMARLALEEGRLGEARERVDRALETDRDSVIGWSLLGDLEQQTGNPEAAEAAYSRAVEASAVPGTFQLRRAQVRAQLDDLAGAKKDLAVLKSYVRDHPQVAFTEGLIELKQGNLLKAQTAFETGLAREPRNALALYYLGSIHFKREQWAEADSYLSRLGDDFPDADRVRRMLAQARLQAGDAEGAERALEALAGGEADAEILALRARIKIAGGDLEAGRALTDQAAKLDPELLEPYVDLGLALLRRGETEAGLRELETAAQRGADSALAQRALFVARLQAGDQEGALAVAQRMRERWPDDPANLVQLGALAAAAGDLSAAKQRFEEALELEPGNPAAASNLARLALSRGSPERARQLYASILSAHPGHLATLVSLALLEREAGNLEAFERQLAAAAGANPAALRPRFLLADHYLEAGEPLKALNLVKEAEQRNPENAAVARGLARIHWALGDMPSAQRAAERLVALSPDSAAAHYLLAEIYAKTGNRDGLKRELLAGLDLDPSDPVSDGLINQLLTTALTLEDANRLLRQLRERYPEHPRFLEQRARSALDDGDPGAAVDIYARALEVYPADRRWVLALARVQRGLGNEKAAAETLGRWLDEHPEDIPARVALANVHLAQGDMERAEADFRQVLAQVPDNVAALNNLAWLLRSKSPDQALGYAERAAEIAGDSPAVQDTLGLVLLERGDLERATRLLLKASTALPESPEIKLHLAMAWSRGGETEKALGLLEPVVESGVDFAGREEAEALVEQLRSR